MKLFPNTDLSVIANPAHPIFKFIEKQFHEWMDGSNPASEYKKMYYGEDAIYTKRGAIEQAIEAAQQEADETQKPVDLRVFDYDAIFQG